MNLHSKVETLRGVGPVVARGLAMAGIANVQDLLQYFPRRYEDYSVVNQINKIVPGPVAIRATIEAIDVRRSARMRRLSITEAVVSDGSGTLKLVWFNQPYLLTSLKKGEKYLFAGKFEFKNGYLSLNSPSFELAGEENLHGKIYPVYPENAILTSKIIQRLVAQCLPLAGELADPLPPEILQRCKLIDLSTATQNLHAPNTMQQVEQAQARLGFEELFWPVLTGMVLKSELKSALAPQINFDLKIVEAILAQLPFALTDAQRKATWQILQDIALNQPMNRLLQGDVGSGKTLVALIAAAMCAKAGLQVAIMVPTEILARQHSKTAQELLGSLGVRSELLISALKKSQKTTLHNEIAEGKISVIIGTHALLAEGVEFANLGLVVIDEQHRFGVGQRAQLRSSSKLSPHVLSMTATPIPRSLTLVIYGDLDVSIIDELPVGRKLVTTKVVKDIDRASVYLVVEQLLAQGQQAYVVCPLIEDSEKSTARSLSAEHKRLTENRIFAGRNIAVLHGKMKPEEKTQIMADFRNKKYHILLSTTVIEVGVDVPNATVLIVENAESFGLAQLHQLRGRVGRSSVQSHCFLFSEAQNPTGYKRLQAMERTNDGFRLAQIDLELRGPGEVYGRLQSGVLDMRFADVFDTQLLALVREEAKALLSKNKMLQYELVVEKINSLKSITSLD